jgi:hypothetical protein
VISSSQRQCGNEWYCCVPIKLYLQNQVAAWIRPTNHSLQILDPELQVSSIKAELLLYE